MDTEKNECKTEFNGLLLYFIRYIFFLLIISLGISYFYKGFFAFFTACNIAALLAVLTDKDIIKIIKKRLSR